MRTVSAPPRRRFRIRLPHGFHALDIGASPGGWTAVLADLTEPHVEPPPLGTEGAPPPNLSPR